MTAIHKELIERFGNHRVIEIPVNEGEMPLLALNIDSRSEVTAIVTNGLSEYKMNVPESLKGLEYNEIFFCLPSYWEWQQLENPNMNWIFPWIQRLTKYVVEKKTWFGHGHTMPCGKDMESLSSTMLQNHFILSSPMLLEKELIPIQLSDKSVQFLAIIPIFGEEMDYKQGKGTLKLLKKLQSRGVNELLDDYRSSVLKSNWRWSK